MLTLCNADPHRDVCAKSMCVGSAVIVDLREAMLVHPHEVKRSIIVFARVVQENYTCLGRAHPLQCDVSCTPIRFVFQLLEFHIIRSMSSFQRLLASQRPVAK